MNISTDGKFCWLSIGSIADALLKNYFLNLVKFGLGLTVSSKISLIPLVSYLVDPASSHMLVSKIKPCMSQYKLLYGETANGSLKQL